MSVSKRLKNVSPQEVRDTIIDVMSSFNTRLEIGELESYVNESLDINVNDSDDATYFKRILNDLEMGGRIKLQDKNVSLSPIGSVDNGEYLPVSLDVKTSNVINVEGNINVFSVGSQYYSEPWKNLQGGQLLEVELIVEDANPYDRNAIAVVYKNEILGHLTRSDAQEYQPILKSLEEDDITVAINALVENAEDKNGYKYLKLLMPSASQLSTLL